MFRVKFAVIAASSAVAAALVALSSAAASAEPAVAVTNVNLRQGPGTTYPVIGKIPAGAPVDVANCSGAWCQVGFAGKSGYVIASALGQGGPPPGYAPPPAVYVVPPPYYGPYYYGFGPYWGGGWGGHGGWGRRR